LDRLTEDFAADFLMVRSDFGTESPNWVSVYIGLTALGSKKALFNRQRAITSADDACPVESSRRSTRPSPRETH
jgi:hypothetical protein